MIRIHMLVEGQTEETFVRDVLTDYFASRNIFLSAKTIKTSRSGKGGGSSYGKIRNDIIRLLEDKNAYVTTMLDYYGLPNDFPGRNSDSKKELYVIINELENAFSQDINEQRFIPNLIVHEFEGMLFSDLDAFADYMDEKKLTQLKKEVSNFPSPEHINNSRETAPSKRIKRFFPKYGKVLDGPLIALKIGIDIIRSKNRHFNEWLQTLESLSNF